MLNFINKKTLFWLFTGSFVLNILLFLFNLNINVEMKQTQYQSVKSSIYNVNNNQNLNLNIALQNFSGIGITYTNEKIGSNFNIQINKLSLYQQLFLKRFGNIIYYPILIRDKEAQMVSTTNYNTNTQISIKTNQ